MGVFFNVYLSHLFKFNKKCYNNVISRTHSWVIGLLLVSLDIEHPSKYNYPNWGSLSNP